jgi:transposase
LLREKVARMLRAHEPLILNWFRAKGEVSSAAVEGLNNKIRVVTRRSYGLRREYLYLTMSGSAL